jgi:uncharacterized protein (TIGR00369 family)
MLGLSAFNPGTIGLMSQSAFDFVRDNIAQTPFHQWLLPELLEVNEEAGSVTIRLPIRPEFCRLPERPELHGAVVAAMVDISGHAAIAAKVLHSVATIDMRVDYLRLAGGTELLAVATVVKLGRTIGVVDVRVSDDQKRLVAIGRAAFVTMNV